MRANSTRNTAASSKAHIRRGRLWLPRSAARWVAAILGYVRDVLMSTPAATPVPRVPSRDAPSRAPSRRRRPVAEVAPRLPASAIRSSATARLRAGRAPGTELAAQGTETRSSAMAIYILTALAIVVLIFLGALVFVDAARRGNRQFKWAGRQPPSEPKA